MKRSLAFCFLLLFILPSTILAQETIQKTYCMSAIGYTSTIDDLKRELLNNAKREAVSELFGELIKSFTKIENFKLTKDKMMAASAGFVRIKGDPTYSQGKNLGELCVKIDAYAKDEDFEKFKPKILTKKSCIAEGDIKTIKKRAEEQSKLEALIDYNQVLKKYPSEQILPLLHEVSFSESGFISNTLVYCTKVKGIIYPIEIAALTEMTSATSLAVKPTTEKPDESSNPTSTTTKLPKQSETSAFVKDLQNIQSSSESLQVTNQNNVVVYLRYINKSQKKLQIMLSQGGETDAGSAIQNYPTYMTDDKGNEYRLKEFSGIGSIRYDENWAHGIPLTLFPGVYASVSLNFKGDSNWEKGSLFSFISAQFILATDKDGNPQLKNRKAAIDSTFNISIRDIKSGKIQ